MSPVQPLGGVGVDLTVRAEHIASGACMTAAQTPPNDTATIDQHDAVQIDSGWREVADTALRFVQRFA